MLSVPALSRACDTTREGAGHTKSLSKVKNREIIKWEQQPSATSELNNKVHAFTLLLSPVLSTGSTVYNIRQNKAETLMLVSEIAAAEDPVTAHTAVDAEVMVKIASPCAPWL